MIEHLKNSMLPRAAANVVGDLVDLVQKEIRLAKAEISEKVSIKLRASLWMGVAGVFGLTAVLLVIEGIVFGLTHYGIALHWSCLIVAAGLALIGVAAYAKGTASSREEFAPSRTIRQVKRDIATAKEHLI